MKLNFLRNGSVVRDSFVVGGAQALGYLLPLATTPILIHRVGMKEYGLFALIQVLGLLTQAIVDYGFSFTATRSVVNARDNRWECNSLLVNVTAAKISLLALCLLTAGLARALLDRADYSAVLLSYFPYSILTLSSILIPLWYFQGIGDLGRAALFTGLARVSSLVAVFIFVRPDTSLFAIALLYTFPALLVASYFWLRELPERPDWRMLEWKNIRSLLIDGRHIFATNALSIGLTNAGPLIISMASGSAVVGAYSAAERVAKTVSYVYGPLTQVVYPRVVASFAKGRYFGIEYLRRVGILYLATGFSVCALIFFGSSYIMKLIGVTDPTSSVILKILSVWVVVSIANNVLGLQLLSALGQTRHYMRCFLASAIVYLAAAFMLTAKFSAMGPALSLSLSEISLFSLVIIKAKQLLGSDHDAAR